jgi:hypothetical protein
MTKPRLLLDANIVIELFSRGVWSRFLSKCEVTLTLKVVEEIQSEDLRPYIQAGRVLVVDVPPEVSRAFLDQFDPVYLGEMHDGETESLAFVAQHTDYLLCSADHIVYKALGRLGLGEQGISLEIFLGRIGQRPKGNLPRQYTEQFRRNCTQEGEQDRIRGRGMRT